MKEWTSSSTQAGDLNPYFADNAKHSVASTERRIEISAPAVHVVKAEFPEKASDYTLGWIGVVPGQESGTDPEARNNVQQVVALINKILNPGNDDTDKHVADRLRDILTDKDTVTLHYYVIQESTRWSGNNPGPRILDQATGRVAEDYIGVDTSNLQSPAAMVILTLLALLPNDKARQSEVQDLMRQIAALLDKLDAGNDTLVSDISPSLLTIEVGKFE